MARPSLTDKERAHRRAGLLAAARPLFRASRELPSVAAIAQAAGIAKGTVYLSFASKEEIFIGLLEESFGQLLARIVPTFTTLPAEPQSAAERFAVAYTALVSVDRDLLPLASIANAVLERNLPLAALVAFKERLAAGLNSAASALSGSALNVEDGRAVDLLLDTWNATLGLWQALDYPKDLRPFLRRGSLSVFKRDFRMELERVVRAVWLGSLHRPLR